VPQVPRLRPRLIQLTVKMTVQLDSEPCDHHAVRLIGLVAGVILLLTGDMGDQRLGAHQRQARARLPCGRLSPRRYTRLT
jgi:hypothetical protein